MGTPDAETAYLADILRTFRNYEVLGRSAMAQVPSDADLHALLDPISNSLAVIVKHISGNLRSRFREFLTTDGEKPDRNRDDEFEMPETLSRAAIVEMWRDGWATALSAIEALGIDDLGRTVYIRGEPFLVIEALNRAATHMAYHVGQIVFLARHFTGSQWKSLSVPKGRSAEVKGEFKTTGLVRPT